MVKRHGQAKVEDPNVTGVVMAARVQIMWANHHLGRFETARRIVSWIIVHAPEYAKANAIEDWARSWPR